jgi:hypothetical protein
MRTHTRNVIQVNSRSGNAPKHFRKEFVSYVLQIIVTVFTVKKEEVQYECTAQVSLQEKETQRLWS